MRDPQGFGQGIAIIGMAARVPDARNVGQLWRNLLDGHEAVREFRAEELRAAGVPEEETHHPAYVPRGTVLDEADRFDAEFFGMAPQEAALTDPQHRIFLQCVWEALEDAGVVPKEPPGPVGVFASTSLSTYLLFNVVQNREVVRNGGMAYPIVIGNDKDFLATRVSYKLGLTGPSMTVQTACSSSMTAVHLACRSLGADECDVAVAGGVSITFPQAGYVYREGGVLSRDGHCRVFDENASGTIKGNGCGVVVLKRLEDAVDAGDQVYAVIRGIALSNDGSDKVGFTAPGIRGQEAALRQALSASGVPVSDIGYIEAHGTGTVLGDPVEFRALARAYGEAAGSGPRVACALGSIKANIGHLDAAAGVIGVIKTALVLRHQTIPPQINLSTANSRMDLAGTPFVIPTSVQLLMLRAAAVSSFGIGGTNGHCVLTHRGPDTARGTPPSDGREYVVVLSARTPQALDAVARDLRDFLEEHSLEGTQEVTLPDLACTLAQGRTRMNCRYAFPARSPAEVSDELARFRADTTPVPVHPVARAWVEGVRLPADALGDFTGARKMSLPTYPFQTRRFWIEPDFVQPGPRQGPTAYAPEPKPVTPVPAGVSVEEIEAQVIAALEKSLGIQGITSEDDYFELGGDSLMAVDLITRLREMFAVELGIEDAGTARKPREMAALIHKLLQDAERQPSVVRIREGEGRPIFLIHPAGGTNLCYVQLARHLGPGRPLVAFTFPYEQRERLRTVEEIAAHYLGQVTSVQPVGPYSLGGYSFGGNVAFEIAVMLQRAGEQVEELFMFDALAPESYGGEHITREDFLAAFPALLESLLGDAGTRDIDRVPRTVDEALELVRRPEWLASTVEEYRRFFEIWEHNHEVLMRYYPGRRFDGSMVVFDVARSGNAVMDRLGLRPLSKHMWQNHVTGSVTIVPVPGDHYTMFTDPVSIAELGAAWDRVLAGAAEGRAAPHRPATLPSPREQPTARSL